MSNIPSPRPAITLEHVWVAAVLALILIGPLVTPVPPNDLWFHVATGQRIVAEGAVPATDSFSYTRAGQPFANQPWLAQLLLYGLNALGGVPLLLVAHALTLLLAYGLLLRLCLRRSLRLRVVVPVFLAALPVSFPDWNIRPQTFAFPLFAAFLYVLTAYRLGWFRRLWLLPPLMALWVNLHGSFPLGLALLGATFVGTLLRRDKAGGPPLPLLGWGAATALATLANPSGLGVLAYVRNLTSNSAVTRLVSEWAAPTVRDAGGLIFFAFVIVGGLVLIYSPRKPDLTDWLMALPLLWMSLSASRNTVWFAFVAVPLVVRAAARPLGEDEPTAAGGSSLANGAIVGMLGLAVLLCLPWVKPLWMAGPQGQLLKHTPVAAVAWLRQQPDRPQRLYHTEAYGSYLDYAAPEQKVFIDTRIELYPFEQWADHLALSSGHDVQALIDKYQIDGMLLSKEQQGPLIKKLRAMPGWQQQYEDDEAVYFRRRP